MNTIQEKVGDSKEAPNPKIKICRHLERLETIGVVFLAVLVIAAWVLALATFLTPTPIFH